MTEPNLRQQIYDVLNVHTPTDCKRWHCWGVEEIEKMFGDDDEL